MAKNGPKSGLPTPEQQHGKKRPPKFDASLRTVELPPAEEQNAKFVERAKARKMPCIQWTCDDNCLREFRGTLLPYEVEVSRHAEKKDWILLMGVSLKSMHGFMEVLGPGDIMIIDDDGGPRPGIGIVRVPPDKRQAN